MTSPTDFIAAYKTLTAQARQQSQPLTLTVLDIAQTVYDAKRALSVSDFILFRRRVNLRGASNDAKVRAMIRIGTAASTLRPLAEHLPPTLSALSAVARIKKDRLTALCDGGQIHPLISSEDARAVGSLHKSTKRGRPSKDDAPEITEPVEPPAPDLSVSVVLHGEDFKYPTVVQFLNDLTDVCQRYPDVVLSLRQSPHLAAVLKVRAPQAAA